MIARNLISKICVVLFVMLFVIGMLQGCASQNDVEIVGQEMKAITAIAKNEQHRINTIYASHSQTTRNIAATEGATPGEKILGMALVAREYSSAARSRMQEILASFKRATLGTDVQTTGLREAGKGIPIAGMTITAREAIQADKGQTTVQTREGDVTLSDSLNETEAHATALDSNESSLSTSTADETNRQETDDHSIIAEEPTEQTGGGEL